MEIPLTGQVSDSENEALDSGGLGWGRSSDRPNRTFCHAWQVRKYRALEGERGRLNRCNLGRSREGDAQLMSATGRLRGRRVMPMTGRDCRPKRETRFDTLRLREQNRKSGNGN